MRSGSREEPVGQVLNMCVNLCSASCLGVFSVHYQTGEATYAGSVIGSDMGTCTLPLHQF